MRHENGPLSWVDFVQRYVRSTQLFDCPSGGPALNLAYDSYGFNDNLGSKDIPPISPAAIANVAQTVMVTDSYAGLTGNNFELGEYVDFPPNLLITLGLGGENWWEHKYIAAGAYFGGNTLRHFEGANVLWADGHVKYAKLPGAITADNTLWDLN